MMTTDEKWMLSALQQAEMAAADGEVPVGAVIVRNGVLIAAAHNQRESHKNALCHAELSAIEQACTVCGGWRLEDCEMYVTLEPCPMCAGAVINARLKRVIYGSADKKAGSCHSVVNLFSLPYPYRPECTGGVLEERCTALLSDFFRRKRHERSEQNKKGIIFDLDGTLWDSVEPVVSAWNSVLQTKGHPLTIEKMKSLMGKTLSEIAAVLLPDLSPVAAQSAMEECCRATDTLLSQQGGQLYDGMEETLSALQKHYALYLVSNCSTGYLDAFFQAHGLQKYFSDSETNGRTGRSKAENIRLVMKRNHLNKAVYVGDTESDRIAAQTAGLPFIYAAYGFGKPKSFPAVIHSPQELPAVVQTLLDENNTPVDSP